MTTQPQPADYAASDEIARYYGIALLQRELIAKIIAGQRAAHRDNYGAPEPTGETK